MRTRSLTAAILSCALVACNGDEQPAQTAAVPVTRDAQLVFTIDAAADAAQALAEQASARAAHQETRSYAATLAVDHGGIADALARTAQQSGVQPAESGVAEELTEEARTASAGMGNLTGLEYDLAFVEGEVRLQQALLAAIDRDLAGLVNPQVRQLATDARPTIEAHARRGRQILTVLREAQQVELAQTAAAASSAAATAPAEGVEAATPTGATGAIPPAQPQPEPAEVRRAPDPLPVPLGVPVRTPPDTNAVRSGVR